MYKNTPVDWSKFKMRCSSLSALFVEPQSKEERLRGELSKTAKKHLWKVYIFERWGRSKDIYTKQMEKGHLVQDEIMYILSVIDGKEYVRNQEEKTNDYIRGTCDWVMDIVDDAKASWDPESFIPNVMEDLSDEYFYQGQGYAWLWGKPSARINHVLVDAPEMVLKNERQRLLWNMNVATDENPEFKEAWAELRENLMFRDIPIEERIVRRTVELDTTIIDQIPAKVEKARQYLMEIERKHIGFNPAKISAATSIPLIKL